MRMLEVKDLSVRYGTLDIVKNVSFSVEEGEWLMIAGPNGAGKSTVVSAIAQSVASTGDVFFCGKNVRQYRSQELARHIGVLEQNHAVNYAFSVREVVGLGRYAYSSGIFAGKSDADDDAVEQALALTGLEALADKSVLKLSGGELQRVFLAQIFAQDPDLLILDEPTNHLDLVYQKQVFSLMGRHLRGPRPEPGVGVRQYRRVDGPGRSRCLRPGAGSPECGPSGCRLRHGRKSVDAEPAEAVGEYMNSW